MSAFTEGFRRGLRDAWAITKVLLIVLAVLGFISCSYYLDHLRFTV